ncbi:InlB B-repeat-containing protein [Vandammella animalimorsus]|uniref:Bacterial repeat domain-containing protein n=1 Tax=Vandammella animalimorsus TaxID=2029117 RepID=A0A2A2AYW2_9BURK|nr:delta-60 repeat domain-containing protein [Vandammella animalimorsus]PAT42931.1 hypothetical protein CK621_06635 [Vandammella animalimorsus]
MERLERAARRWGHWLAGAALALGAASAAQAQSLSLDTGFDYTYPYPHTIYPSYGVGLLPDGRLWTTDFASLSLLKPNGSLDRRLSEVGSHNFFVLVQQPDGRMLVGGGLSEVGGHSTGGVARLAPNGSVDTSFTAPSIHGDANFRLRHLAWAPGDRVLVGGALTAVGTAPAHGLARLNADGSRDTGFANALPYGSEVTALHALPDGGALAGVSNPPDPAQTGLYRLRPDGTVQWFRKTGGQVRALAVLPSGDILVGGRSLQIYPSAAPFDVYRLKPDGEVDFSFQPTDLGSEQVWAMHVLPNGQILLGGTTLALLNPDGARNTSVSLPALEWERNIHTRGIYHFTPQPDGKLLVGGDSIRLTEGGQSRDILARLTPAGLPSSFHAITLATTPADLASNLKCTYTMVEHGGETTCTVSPPGNWVFTGFGGDCASVAGASCTLTNVTSPKSVTATFAPPVEVFTVASPAGGGNVTCTPNPVARGGNVSCTASANAGYTFSGFSGPCFGGQCHLTNVTAPVTVTAHFATPGSHPIATGVQPAGAGTVQCTPNPVATGGASVCVATPAAGFAFGSALSSNASSACSPDASGGAVCTLTGVGLNASFRADFVQADHAITVQANPAGGGEVVCTPAAVPTGGTSFCGALPAPGFGLASLNGCDTVAGLLCSLTNVTTDRTVTAQFAPLVGSASEHVITATASPAAGGYVVCTPNPVPDGSTAVCRVQAKGGYVFDSFGGDCTSVAGESCDVAGVTGPKTVTANFTRVGGGAGPHAIVATANPAAGGAVTCAPNPVPNGDSATCTATANAGFAFDGFSGDCAGATCNLTNVLAAQAVVATFKPLTSATHAITVTPSANGSVTCTPNPVPHGSDAVCTATPAAGYALGAFGGDCSGTSCVLSNVTAPKTVSATFVMGHAITATASPAAGGTVICTPNPVPNGGNASCTATANAGYTFSAFSGDCAGASCALTNVTSAKSVTASFTATATTHAITATANPAAGGTVSCTPNPVPDGDDATCTATPATGYAFDGFGGDCASATGDSCTLSNVTAPKNVVANFKPAAAPAHAITATANPAAGGTVVCSPNPVPDGDDATCTATPATGYAFDGFGGDCASATGDSCTLSNVTAPKNVVANFKPAAAPAHAITATANPAAGGTVVCSPNPVPDGGNATCTATANAGFVFNGFGGACAAATGPVCTLGPVSAPLTVSAQFIAAPTPSGAVPVPTLRLWALLLLALAAAGLGGRAMRQRRA